MCAVKRMISSLLSFYDRLCKEKDLIKVQFLFLDALRSEFLFIFAVHAVVWSCWRLIKRWSVTKDVVLVKRFTYFLDLHILQVKLFSCTFDIKRSDFSFLFFRMLSIHASTHNAMQTIIIVSWVHLCKCSFNVPHVNFEMARGLFIHEADIKKCVETWKRLFYGIAIIQERIKAEFTYNLWI